MINVSSSLPKIRLIIIKILKKKYLGNNSKMCLKKFVDNTEHDLLETCNGINRALTLDASKSSL